MNVILTFLITAKLIFYRRKFKNASSSADPVRFYTSLLTIFIESAALYSTFAICFLATYAANNPINQIFLGFTTAAQVSRRRSLESPHMHNGNVAYT